MRYIHYELPSDVVKKREGFYFVRDGEDLQKKYDAATKWLSRIMLELDKGYFSNS